MFIHCLNHIIRTNVIHHENFRVNRKYLIQTLVIEDDNAFLLQIEFLVISANDKIFFFIKLLMKIYAITFITKQDF